MDAQFDIGDLDFLFQDDFKENLTVTEVDNSSLTQLFAIPTQQLVRNDDAGLENQIQQPQALFSKPVSSLDIKRQQEEGIPKKLDRQITGHLIYGRIGPDTKILCPKRYLS